MEKHEDEIRRMAREIRTAALEMSGKYYTLCKYIRDNQLHPRTVSMALKAEGLSRHICSKINRVANCADYYWNEYAAREIGFKRVLDMTRNEARLELASNSTLTLEQVTEHSLARTKAKADQESERKSERVFNPEREVERAVAILGGWADLKKLKRKKTWNIGNGYTVTVERTQMLPRGNISKVPTAETVLRRN
jgi:hypothetical protein